MGILDAAESYVENVLRHAPDERIVSGAPDPVESEGSLL